MEEETKLTIVSTKEVKSTTKVRGIQVECSNGMHYVITKMQPGTNPWFIRCMPSNSAGKTSTKISDEIFSLSMGSKGEPDFQVGKELLIDILNGAEAPKDKMYF